MGLGSWHRGRWHGRFGYQFLSPNVLYEPSPIVDAGKPENYPLDSVTLDVNAGIYVVHTAEGFFALSAVCTHLGCLTAWKPDLGIIACPCHGSKFKQEGVKIEGPAPKPLPWLRMWLSDDGDLLVDRSSRHTLHGVREGLSMAKDVDKYFRRIARNRVWRSMFRSGTGASTLHRALAFSRTFFYTLFSTKVRKRVLEFSATWYLGTLTLGPS